MLTYDQALKDLADYGRTIETLRAENAKLRGALKTIAECEPKTCDSIGIDEATMGCFDGVKSIARQALGP